MISRTLTTVTVFFLLTILSFGHVNAQTYETGTVKQIQQEQEIQGEEQNQYTQILEVEKKDGSTTEIQNGMEFQPINESQLLAPGDTVVLAEDAENNIPLSIADRYRLPTLIWLAAGFVLLVTIVAGKKGLFSVVGMFISLLILVKFLVPNILAGVNPLAVSIAAAAMIAGITVYLSHGFSLKSHISLFSMMTTLILVTVLAHMAVTMAHLLGFGSEEASFLQIGTAGVINLQGLLLGGIMLGALGVLDDICMSQVSMVFELRKANKELTFYELYHSGMNVGKDHVASLVNTLMLAYAGTNLPLFILFSTSTEVPLWVRFNSEFIAEEVVRTLVGSIGLVLAVPLTTAVAAYWANTLKIKN